jgi:tetratricopeptide (TPR) repeat protein
MIGIGRRPGKNLSEAWKSVLKQALVYDPLSLIINATVGLVFYYGRQYDTAIEHYLKTLKMDANFPMAHFFLGQAYVQKGKYQKAVKEFQESLKFFGNSTNMLSALGNAVTLSGKQQIAEKVIEKLHKIAKKTYVSPYDMATLYAGLKDKDRAFQYLEQAVSERAYLLLYIQVDPVMDSLRSDERFQVILKKMNLL